MKLLCQSEVHSKSRKVCRSQGARVTLSDTFFCTFVADLRLSLIHICPTSPVGHRMPRLDPT